jgi:hypothetical protein
LGYYENEPVATLTSYMCEGVLGLYNAATLPKIQGNGLCIALTQTAIKEAKKLGCKLAVSQLDHPNLAQNLSQKLGFQSCCYIYSYIFQNISNKVRIHDFFISRGFIYV